MSIAIVATTERAGLVATDSKVSGDHPSEIAPKIFTYNSELAFFGVGNIGVCSVLRLYMQGLQKREVALSFNLAIDEMLKCRKIVESDPCLKNYYGLYGVISYTQGQTRCAYVYVDGHNPNQEVKTLGKNDLKIFPPPDLTESQCIEWFTSKCQQEFSQLAISDLLLLAGETIHQANLLSEYVNNRVQYFGYNFVDMVSQKSNLAPDTDSFL